jgi:hypothetical protein
MGPKIRVISISMLLFVSSLCSFSFFRGTIAQGTEPEMHDVLLYFHGDLGNATLNTTSNPHEEEQHVLTTGPEDTFFTQIYIGEWVTKPISYPMYIQGEVIFAIYAIGTLQQVSFIAQLTVNGVRVSSEMVTSRQNLNESLPTEFPSDPVNLTQPLELNTTDTIGLELSLDHNDPRFYEFYPPPGVGKNVTLVYGIGVGCVVQIHTNSISITDIIGRDDPVTKNMIVTATIKCSFGYEDFNYATAKSNYGLFTWLSDTIVDDATVEVDWEWAYTVTEGGSYPVTITVKDGNYLTWKLTKDIPITTPTTELDFSITSSDISFSNDPQKDKNTTITAKIKGSGIRWSSYQVDIEFYDDSELIEKIKATISRGGTNDISLLWVPDEIGSHQITVKIDPEDDFSETDENNNEASKTVDVKEGSGGGTPGFESLFLILAICIALFLGKRYRRA